MTRIHFLEKISALLKDFSTLWFLIFVEFHKKQGSIQSLFIMEQICFFLRVQHLLEELETKVRYILLRICSFE